MTPIRRSLRTACAIAALIVCAPLARAEDAPAAPAANPKACSGPECRQFDFWLGPREVHLADGSLAGNNRIEADVDGCAVLAGDPSGADGKPTRNRVTWTPLPNRHVRQLWESSTDGGTTWTVEFDGDYAPKPAA